MVAQSRVGAHPHNGGGRRASLQPMRRASALAAVAIVTACGTGSAGEGATFASASVPRLELAQLYPLTVRGFAFRGKERVRVTVLGPRDVTQSVVADRAGRFTVRFAVPVPRCGSILVRAVGSTGSRASRQLPRPDCREP